MEYKSTILVVDDEAVGRETLEALLYTQNYKTIFASNGQEALQKAAEFKPDVILLDVMMPGMDGFEVCQRLRNDPNLAEIPIVMVTALDDQKSRLRGIEVGADDFISKPFNSTELRARVQTITRLNRYQRLVSERAKFEWVVEQADDGYLVLNDNDEILYANPQARHFLGFLEKEADPIIDTFLALVAKQRFQFQPQEAWGVWPEQSIELIPRYLVQPASLQADAFWLQVNVMQMTSELDNRYLVRLQDVTANVAERRSTWAFHSHVSHKLRTPLSLLDGFIELLTEKDAKWSLEQREIYRLTSRRNAIELRNNILDIFQYLKVKDLIKLGQGVCNIAQVSDLVNQINNTIRLKPIEVKYNGILDNSEDSYIPLSPKATELILWELMENSQKFHPKQSPALDINILGTENSIQIQVIDDGLTLSSKQLGKIWTPYYQAERGFSGQTPGMGLGLSMISSLIWSVGGTCRAYNRDDCPGLIVELALPIITVAETLDLELANQP